ncbi:hypothetical protein DPMN_013286 [Dreissena polymorpha]|uniref:C-type lectin domain-containing protein n=1 Tax=Dreissena polymorpha TaxID=45954 RepID=A0A9D4N569_DREPO|nr:hypothetical protein DPMN_013286 [Dreissena polymorpha]
MKYSVPKSILTCVQEKFQKATNKNKTHYFVTAEYWLGATDLQVDGTFRWHHSQEVVGTDFRSWAPGNPSGGPENCMEIVVGF